jgi:hypothetical protein
MSGGAAPGGIGSDVIIAVIAWRWRRIRAVAKRKAVR